jgi:hypothetical protein
MNLRSRQKYRRRQPSPHGGGPSAEAEVGALRQPSPEAAAPHRPLLNDDKIRIFLNYLFLYLYKILNKWLFLFRFLRIDNQFNCSKSNFY